MRQSKLCLLALLDAAFAAPAALPQVSGISNSIRTGTQSVLNTATPTQYSGTGTSTRGTTTRRNPNAIPTSFTSDSAVSFTRPPTLPVAPVRSSQVTGRTSHGTYRGPPPTTTGAPQFGPTASSVPALPPNPTATYYNTNGLLQQPEPAPYTPAGGLGTNGTLPRYMVNSDFDFQSITLGLYQEWIELDLFHNGLARFSARDFLNAGLTAEDRSLIEYMADQEVGHATLLSNMLGETAPPQCTYNYPFTTVREFVDFCQRLTRFGEDGVWGYINHLDSREVAQLLSQSIATEARQELIFRQMSGLKPMNVWFETGYPQSWAWTYLAPYISSCPANTTRLAWQNFPTLHILNNPNINRWSPNDTAMNEVVGRRIADPSNSTIPEAESCIHTNVTGYGCGPAISRNKTEPLSFPGKIVYFQWDRPGQFIGPNNSYITTTASLAANPSWVLWANQLNVTYTPLTVTGNNTGFTYQPNATVYAGDPLVNDTMSVALTDLNLYVTPFNLTMVNPHIMALGMYMAG